MVGTDGIDVELLPADIVLVRGHNWTSRLIRFLTGSQFNHASLIVSKTVRGGKYVIAEADKTVVTRVLSSRYNVDDVAVFRDPTLTDEMRWNIAATALEMTGRPYDFILPFKLMKRYGWRYVLRILWDMLRHPREARIPHIKDRWLVCSEMVQEAYSEHGVPLVPDDQLLVPGHVERFGFLVVVYRGKNIKERKNGTRNRVDV